MVIDLKKCYGCNACVLACKQEHFLPPDVFCNHLIIAEKGIFPDVEKLMVPTICNHCGDPVCAEVCPTGSSYQREDGIVVIDPDKCNGCQYCIMACPYNQRNYIESTEKSYYEQGKSPREKLGEHLYPIKARTVMKCSFCAERIDEGLKKGLQPGVDREATPACVITCYTKARIFGDLDDPNSEVSKLIRENNPYTLCPESGAEPSVYYID
jgi:Fe-S-cluster-containing dehydrogenase component